MNVMCNKGNHGRICNICNRISCCLSLTIIIFIVISLSTFLIFLWHPWSSDFYVNNKDYSFFCFGHCNKDAINDSSKAGFVINGGAHVATDALIQLTEWSNNGDYLMITAEPRAIGKLSHLFWHFLRYWFSQNSYTFISIKTRKGADSTFISNKLEKSEVIYIPGHPTQRQYIELWENTLLQTTLQNCMSKSDLSTSILTSSAGSFLASEWVFPNNRDPTRKFIKFGPSEDHILPQTIVDTHLTLRNRMGRLLSFIDELYINNHVHVNGIGINDDTSIVIDKITQKGSIMSDLKEDAFAWIIIPDKTDRELFVVQKLSKGDTYDFKAFVGGKLSQRYTINGIGESLPEDPYSPNHESLE